MHSVTLAVLRKQTLVVKRRDTREGKAEPIVFRTRITRLHELEDHMTLPLTRTLERGGPVSCPHRQNSDSDSQSGAEFLLDADQANQSATL